MEALYHVGHLYINYQRSDTVKLFFLSLDGHSLVECPNHIKAH